MLIYSFLSGRGSHFTFERFAWQKWGLLNLFGETGISVPEFSMQSWRFTAPHLRSTSWIWVGPAIRCPFIATLMQKGSWARLIVQCHVRQNLCRTLYSCQHVLSDGKLDIWLTFVSPEPRKWVKRYVFHHLKTKNAIPVQKIMKSTTSRRLLAQVQTVVAACGGRGDCVLCTVFHHVLSTILITNKKRYRDSGASGKVTKTVV